jgi:hypothetical protein
MYKWQNIMVWWWIRDLLALPRGKRLCIYVRFGLGDELLAHSLANVELTNVHKMKIFSWL